MPIFEDMRHESGTDLLCDGDEQLLPIRVGLGRGVGAGHGPQLGAHLVQLLLHDLLHRDLQKKIRRREKGRTIRAVERRRP